LNKYILRILYRHFYAAVAILSGLLIGSIILNGYISYVYGLILT